MKTFFHFTDTLFGTLSLKGGLSSIFDIQEYNGELYICGRFNKLDGNIGNGILRWNGQQWKEVGAGFCDPFSTASGMLVHRGKLYVVGNFECVDEDIPVSKIAVWDGSQWSSLGNSFFNNGISCIGSYKGEIYIGGGFTEVDGKPCRYLARWVDYEDGKYLESGFGLWPNPVGDILQLIAPTSITSIDVFDAAGRIVIKSIEVNESRVSVQLAHLPSGLYFVVLRADGQRWSGRFVKD